MNPIPFEKEFPREAEFLMSVYQEGKCVPMEIRTPSPRFLPVVVIGGEYIAQAPPPVIVNDS